MDYSSKRLEILQKNSSLQKKIRNTISNCLQTALDRKNLSSIDSKLKAAIEKAITNFEFESNAMNLVHYDSNFDFKTDGAFYNVDNITNPEIDKLKQKKSSLESEIRFKEDELKNLNRRMSLTRELTRQEAINGLVLNIVKKFKTMPPAQQLELVEDKTRLSRIIKNYIKKFIVYFDEEKNAWSVNFTKKRELLDDLSTGKDVVVLAANLSSKYVHLATSGAHNLSKIQHEICKMERDELKEKLVKVNRLLQIEYAKDGRHGGFKGGFGGGQFGGSGAFIDY